MTSKIESHSQLLLDLCKKHSDLLNFRTDLYHSAKVNDILSAEHFQSYYQLITNEVIATYKAFQLVRHLLFGTTSYNISFEELINWYENNSSLTHTEALILLSNKMQKLIGNDVSFEALLLEDYSIQINFDTKKTQGWF